MTIVNDIKKKVQDKRENIIQFMREICAIPSMDGQLKDVGERIQAEMRKLGFDEARFDRMGNTIGRIGNGPKVVVFDSHIDTVGMGSVRGQSGEWHPVCARCVR
jgi:acetylornithine deacetylase/succinyl-diaminopimelate desuccinylase-like protein